MQLSRFRLAAIIINAHSIILDPYVSNKRKNPSKMQRLYQRTRYFATDIGACCRDK